MIPKKIHFCWFGDQTKMPKTFLKNRKEKLPDYELKLWNEKNFDVDKYNFSSQAYKHKKFAYVSDVARIEALKNEGGIYLDTDVEILKSFDELLKYQSFFGFEDVILSSAVIGSEKNLDWHQQILDFYKKDFEKDEYIFTLPNTFVLTNFFSKKNLLKLNGKTQVCENYFFGSQDYFSPKDYLTGKIKLGENSYCIHHFDGSWLGEKDKKAFKILKFLKFTKTFNFFQKKTIQHQVGFLDRKIDKIFYKKIGN